MTRRNRFYRAALFTPSPKPRPRKGRLVGYILWKALRRTCTAIGAVVLFSIIVSIIATSALLKGVQPEKPLPDEMVLYWRADSNFSEGHTVPRLDDPSSFIRQGNTLRSVVDMLDLAAKDERVKGLVVLMSGGLGTAHISELQEAVKDFKKSGKFAYISSSSYGETGRGLGAYYFASAFDEIWLQPVGTLSISGISMEMPFAKDLFDKVGIGAQFFQREEYKSVFEGATHSEMSQANREMSMSMINDIADFLVTGISENRHMGIDHLKAQIDKGILTAEEALSAGLVDYVDYNDNLERVIKDKVKGNPEFDEELFVSIKHYERKSGHALKGDSKPSKVSKNKKPEIALVYINGVIANAEQYTQMGRSDYIFFGGEAIVPAREISSALRNIAEDDDIKTLVIRINSPGGTPDAAERIHHAIMRVKEKGKSVIVSMGGVAASAGYWIAVPADVIFTTPATLTGSIGVAGGKFNAEGFWQKLGVNWDGVKWGQNAGMMSINQPFSEVETERMNTLMDNTYATFLERVAIGRNMKKDAVREIAKGRVWTGRQAVENGLADQLGGLSDTLDYAAVMAGAKDRTGVKVSVYPKPKKPIEQLMEILEQQVRLGRESDARMALFSVFRPVLDNMAAMSLARDGRLSYEFRRLD